MNVKRERGLHISGTKPVLIGRILDFQATGDAKHSNKRNIKELKNVAEQAPSKKNKNASKLAKELQKYHTKNAYVQHCRGLTRDFNHLCKQYEITGPHLDFCNSYLSVEYDKLSMENFIEDMRERNNELVSLNLSGHKYLCKEFFEKVQFPVLEALSADNSHVLKDEDLSELLSACPSLIVLNLLYSFMGGDAFEDIHTKCPNLQWIKISTKEVKLAISHLHKCENLDTLEVIPCELFDDEDIERLVAMPNLKSCKIQFNEKITQKGIELLQQKPSFTLESFPADDVMPLLCSSTAEFKPEPDFTLEKFKEAISKMSHLKILSFGNFDADTECDVDDALECVSNSPCAATLETVDISMQDITDKAIKALGKMKAIKDLNLGFSWGNGHFFTPLNVEQENFVQASKSWKNLETLDISWSPISIENLERVVLNCPKLKKIDVTGCSGGDDLVSFDWALQDSDILSRVHITHKRM